MLRKAWTAACCMFALAQALEAGATPTQAAQFAVVLQAESLF